MLNSDLHVLYKKCLARFRYVTSSMGLLPCRALVWPYWMILWSVLTSSLLQKWKWPSGWQDVGNSHFFYASLKFLFVDFAALWIWEDRLFWPSSFCQKLQTPLVWSFGLTYLPQQAHSVKTTLIRCLDVESTLFQRCVPAGALFAWACLTEYLG